jgi:hypothetical protein
MSALPVAALGSVFSAEQYRLGMRWWLGVPLLASLAGSPCPGCTMPVDAAGDHFLCCKRNNFADRHDAVQDALFNILSGTGHAVSKEVPLQHALDSHLRPADLLVPTWHEGKPLAIDVTVVHGWTLAAASVARPQPRDNWRPFLRRKEERKHAKYDEPCAREGWHFAPAGFGTWGGVGPEGSKIISRMLKRAVTAETPEHRGVALRGLQERIGVALFRQVWRLLEAKNLIC